MINSKMRIKSPMLPLVVSVFLLFYPFPAASGTDSKAVVLTCGASNTGKDADGREWSPDAEYFTSSISASSAASSQDPSLPSEVPYMTARTFMSDATYSLPAIADQRYWIRLHFYPATYGSLNPNDAYLDVIADGVQLLKNFSVTQTSKALTQAYIVKEYSLAPPASASLINITFTPSMNGSYAFVNGIELIPFPNLFRSFGKMIGVPDEKIDVNTSSFETVHRLNVGGRYIAPAIDPASRTWYDDTPYLYGENVGVTTNSSGRIDYDGMPESIAPVDVYSTARSMGYDYNLNLMYNLTWQFQVDVNFNYLLRLHFCDYQARGVNQIVFDIFVNGELAEAGVDIIGWTNKSSVPVYKDYVIFVKENSRNDEHITLALHPATDADEQPEFFDALLNGLEIFKMDDPMRNLAGPNPRPSNMLLRAEAKEAARAGQAMARFSAAEDGIHVMGGAAGGAAFGAMAVICMTAYIKKRKVQGVDGSTAAGSLPISGLSQSDGSKSSHSTSTSHLSLVAQGFCRQERTDSFAEISLADNHDMNHGRELEDNDGSAEIFSQIGNPTGR
ncbi:hypothetical protein SAY87_027011 [Trapa incisa]|uniref:Malectin-like domain-containing protein n=1 Tax=Trapa incisa TaxID=236973 RepID=A0AAN7H4C7_9MYRT|nr:hypothetical protein SAY87_027011 [Trapa incisa]